jgi:hypothetical protein
MKHRSSSWQIGRNWNNKPGTTADDPGDGQVKVGPDHPAYGTWLALSEDREDLRTPALTRFYMPSGRGRERLSGFGPVRLTGRLPDSRRE